MKIVHRLPFEKLISSKFRLYSSDAYLTTPIFYANGSPHVGHLHTVLLADAAARFEFFKGSKNVTLSVGTDEHGQKVEQSALRVKQSADIFCNGISHQFKVLFDLFNVSYSHFIRTTDHGHKLAVQNLWNVLQTGGYVEKSNYSGWYSMIEECFIPDTEVVPCTRNTSDMLDSATGNQVEWLDEENYVFKLGEFVEPIRRWILESDVIQPDHYKAFLLKDLEHPSMRQLSISRPASRLQWSIDVPGDPSQKVYVWLDALTNYLTVAGYPSPNLAYWPPSVQFIGKDILKFHAIYWPAFLMAANLPLPKKIFVHAHWLANKEKMSKSKGNVVDPISESKKLTIDGMRYFMLRHSVPHKDTNYNTAKAMQILNAELCNMYANLLSRSVHISMNKSQTYPTFSSEAFDLYFQDDGPLLVEGLHVLPEMVCDAFETHHFYKGIEKLTAAMRQTHAFYQYHTPWKFRVNPNDHANVDTTNHVTYEALRVISLLLQPICPSIAASALDRLGVLPHERSLEYCKVFDKCPVRMEGRPLGPDTGQLFSRLK